LAFVAKHWYQVSCPATWYGWRRSCRMCVQTPGHNQPRYTAWSGPTHRWAHHPATVATSPPGQQPQRVFAVSVTSARL